jgi:hypothetical protein
MQKADCGSGIAIPEEQEKVFSYDPKICDPKSAGVER